jgi:hypothetical protein
VSTEALKYFSINPDDGRITIVKDLRTDTTKAEQYKVRLKILVTVIQLGTGCPEEILIKLAILLKISKSS